MPAQAGIVVSGGANNEQESMSKDAGKQAAAHAALEYVVAGEVLGVGTGSTVNFLIEELATRKIRIAGAVSSSNGSTQRLEAAGIPVLDLNDVGEIQTYIDGADETNRKRQLIKGGGAMFCSGGCVVQLSGDTMTQAEVLAGLSARF